jgi:hypothetical protein
MRHCKNERIKNNLVAMDKYALLVDITLSSVAIYDYFSTQLVDEWIFAIKDRARKRQEQLQHSKY